VRASLTRAATAAAVVLLVGAGVAAGTFVRMQAGLEATWAVSSPAGDTVLGRTVERRPWFPSRDRPVGAVLARWDFARLGVPATLPRVRVGLAGTVAIPRGGLRLVPRQSGGLVRVRVDGRPADAAAVVSAGTHALEVEWLVDLTRDVSLALDGCAPPPAPLGAPAGAPPAAFAPAPDLVLAPSVGPASGAVPPPTAPPAPGVASAPGASRAPGAAPQTDVAPPADDSPSADPAPPADAAPRADAAPPADATPHGDLAIAATASGERCAELPVASLRPPAGRGGLLTLLAPLAVAALAVALAALVFAGLAARDPRRGRALRFAAAGLAITAAAVALRLFDYAAVPYALENDDWLFAAWNGWQLLTDGTTRGWTSWPEHYWGLVSIDKHAYFDATTQWSVIQPYLEHPPLLHLLVGAAAKIGGADHWLHVRLAHARLVPVGLGAASVALVLAVGRRLYPRGPAALFAGLLYAALPFVALQAREVKEEALVVPLGLASLLFFLRWRDGVGPPERRRRRRRVDLVLAALCAGLAPLAKVPAASFVPALVVLVLGERDRPWRDAGVAAAVGLAVAALLLPYGAWQSWELFEVTMRVQASGRPSHWSIFPRWFGDAQINFNLVGRGWLTALWVMFAGAVLTRRRTAEPALTVPLLAYMVAISLSSGNWTFGWYAMPLYPLLALGAGAFLADLWDAPDLWRATPFWLLLVMYGIGFLAPIDWQLVPHAWPLVRKQVNLYVLLGLVPFGLAHVLPGRATRALARLGVLVGLAVFVATSVHFVVAYDELAHSFFLYDRKAFFDH
jgi:4-amino-4-deoxy-L-arabinose transferase-like glycosyltransferase